MEAFDPTDHGPAGLCGCDRELFAQVWARVAPAEGPVVPLPPPPLAEGPACPLTPTGSGGEGATRPPDAAPALLPTPRPPARHDSREEEVRALHLLSAQCAGEAAAYRAVKGPGREGLGTLAATKDRHAKRLGAAAFLLTGVRALPTPPAARRQAPLPFLRARFWAEQRLAGRLTALAEATADPGLRELYFALADETRALVPLLRALVETL